MIYDDGNSIQEYYTAKKTVEENTDQQTNSQPAAPSSSGYTGPVDDGTGAGFSPEFIAAQKAETLRQMNDPTTPLGQNVNRTPYTPPQYQNTSYYGINPNVIGNNTPTRVALNDRGVYAPVQTVQPSPKAPVSPRVGAGDYIIPGNEPILNMNSTSDRGVLGGMSFKGAIVGAGTRIGVGEDNMERNSSRYLQAYDLSNNAIPNAYYDVEEKAINFVNTRAYEGKTYAETPYYNRLGKTGNENLIASAVDDYYNKNAVQNVYSNYNREISTPSPRAKSQTPQTTLQAGISGNSSMMLGNREYSDPLNAKGIFETGEKITSLGGAAENFAYNIAKMVPGGSFLAAANTPIFLTQKVGAGIVGGLVSGVGAGIGLAEASVQDLSRGDTDKLIGSNDYTRFVPKTISEGFSGGVMGNPKQIERELTIGTNQRVDYVDQASGKVVKTEYRPTTTTMKVTDTVDMPNVLESVTAGIAPSVFSTSKGYLSVKDNLSVMDVGTGAMEAGINAGVIFMGAKAGSTPRVSRVSRGSSVEAFKIIDGKTPNLEYVVGETPKGELSSHIINTETGAPLPWRVNDISSKTKGITSNDLLYQRDQIPIYDITRSTTETDIGFMKSNQPAIRYTGKEITEPDIKAYVDLDSRTRSIDIAPKTSDEQFGNTATTPRVESKLYGSKSASIKTDTGGVSIQGLRRTYTEENYLGQLGVDPASLLFKRRPGSVELDFTQPRFTTVPTITGASMLSGVTSPSIKSVTSVTSVPGIKNYLDTSVMPASVKERDFTAIMPAISDVSITRDSQFSKLADVSIDQLMPKVGSVQLTAGITSFSTSMSRSPASLMAGIKIPTVFSTGSGGKRGSKRGKSYKRDIFNPLSSGWSY